MAISPTKPVYINGVLAPDAVGLELSKQGGFSVRYADAHEVWYAADRIEQRDGAWYITGAVEWEGYIRIEVGSDGPDTPPWYRVIAVSESP